KITTLSLIDRYGFVCPVRHHNFFSIGRKNCVLRMTQTSQGIAETLDHFWLACGIDCIEKHLMVMSVRHAKKLLLVMIVDAIDKAVSGVWIVDHSHWH